MEVIKERTPIRPGLKDLWNSRLVHDTTLTPHGNPYNPYQSTTPVKAVVPWDRAITLHHKMLHAENADYRVHAHIHFYIDDSKFDGPRSGVWANPNRLVELARHFDGVMGIDFSTYADFPEPLKRWQVYRIRALEYYLASQGIEVVQNLRWSGPETWDYFLDVLHHHTPLSLGTVGSGLRQLENRPPFNRGLLHAIELLEPPTLYVVGSANLPVFDIVRHMGTRIIRFDSTTAIAYKGVDAHV